MLNLFKWQEHFITLVNQKREEDFSVSTETFAGHINRLVLVDLICIAIVLPQALWCQLWGRWRANHEVSFPLRPAPLSSVAEVNGGRGDTSAAIFSCDVRDIPPQSQTRSFHQHPDSLLCEAVIHYRRKIDKYVVYCTTLFVDRSWLGYIFLCVCCRRSIRESVSILTECFVWSACGIWSPGPSLDRQRESNRGRLLYTVELSAVCSSGFSQAVIFGLNGAYVKERPVGYFVTYRPEHTPLGTQSLGVGL